MIRTVPTKFLRRSLAKMRPGQRVIVAGGKPENVRPIVSRLGKDTKRTFVTRPQDGGVVVVRLE